MASFADLMARLTGRGPVREERLELPGVPTSADLLAAIVRVETLVADSAVPAPVASRVARVTRVVRDAIARLDRLGAGSEQAYSVMATATDYLPEAIGGYLRLPRDWANSRPVDNGRSSLSVGTCGSSIAGGGSWRGRPVAAANRSFSQATVRALPPMRRC